MVNSMSRSKICTKTVISVVIVVFVMTFVVGCTNQMYEKEEIFKSPTGKKEVIVKVDYVSRPDVFCDNECIFQYEGSGFNETVYWDVEWLSEEEIRLYLSAPSNDKYADESYMIELTSK